MIRKLALTAALCAACGGALATMSVSTTGSTTTYVENFNGGTSFSAGWFNAPFSGDDHLWLSLIAPSSSYTFQALSALQSLSLGFWYSVPGANNATLSIGSASHALPDTPGNFAQFLLNNPGPDQRGTGAYDAYFTTTLYNLDPGSYTVTFAINNLLSELKVDDLTMVAVAAPIPEPETYALMLAGLGAIGVLVRRRQRGAH